MMEGWGSCFRDRTTFISFHLRETAQPQARATSIVIQRTYSDRTLAAVVEVLDLWTSLTAILLS